MKTFKIVLTRGEDFYLKQEELDRLLNSPSQIVSLLSANGEIKYLINKAHIVSGGAEKEVLDTSKREELVEHNINDQERIRKTEELKGKAHKLFST